ncbi:sensor histidine kinase [Geodermatophilus sp. SYSU D01176]
MLFVVYGSAVRLGRRAAAVHLGAVLVAAVVLLRLSPMFPGWLSVVLYVALITSAWSLGAVIFTLQSLARENAQRAAELEQARLELARHAVAAERVRMARELHDVIAHNMSVIAMHAGVARLAVGTDPDAERGLLAGIEGLSRNALAEMRRLVTFLRDQDDAAAEGQPAGALDPAPSLRRLHELVSRVVEAGVTVDVHVDGALDDVPPGVSLSAYRVIQEALTNVLRHAGPTTARLSVAAQDGMVSICVENDRPITAVRRAIAPGGHGTIGMRERAELYGGTLLSAPSPEGAGGWRHESRTRGCAGDPCSRRRRPAPGPGGPARDVRARPRHRGGRGGH